MTTHQGTYDGRARDTAASNAVATGFVLFAAVFMIVGGVFNAIQGLSALLEDEFFIAVANYAYDLDLTTWGWIHFVGGIVVALTGFFLLSGSIWARILAVFFAVVSALINFVFIPYAPIQSIILLVIDGAIIWALIAQGNLEAEESYYETP